jgi:hypothetical protein
VLFADLERHALSQRVAFVGTAGSVVERTNASGFPFYSHQYYDGDGKKRERYLGGPIGDADADRAAGEMRARIHETKDLVPSLRLLGREGYLLVDPRTYATVASLHNHGIFAAGAILIGSHAYGVLLNRMGIRAATYATEDVDIARGEALSFAEPGDASLLQMLRDSGIDFVEVPSLDRRRPSTSWKQVGRSRFHVALLVPAPRNSAPTVAVPELQAHATGLPYLDYLLAESQVAALIAREGTCAARVPMPERFAIHKLIVSRLRTGREAKSQKDLAQAAVLCAALAELHPGAIESSLAAVPTRARKPLRQGLLAVKPRLAKHPRALEELGLARS